jgi:hypothetical protein
MRTAICSCAADLILLGIRQMLLAQGGPTMFANADSKTVDARDRTYVAVHIGVCLASNFARLGWDRPVMRSPILTRGRTTRRRSDHQLRITVITESDREEGNHAGLIEESQSTPFASVESSRPWPSRLPKSQRRGVRSLRGCGLGYRKGAAVTRRSRSRPQESSMSARRQLAKVQTC